MDSHVVVLRAEEMLDEVRCIESFIQRALQGSGLLNSVELAQDIADGVAKTIGVALVAVAISDGNGSMTMSGTTGARTNAFRRVQVTPGQGIGGRALQQRKLISVADYLSDPRISNHFAEVVAAEGLGGMIAVPIEHGGEFIALLYAGIRSVGTIGDRAKIVCKSTALSVAPVMSLSLRTKHHTDRLLLAERQRLAMDLHDDIGQLLFGIGAAARRMQGQSTDDEDLRQLASRIETQAQSASEQLRTALSTLTEADDSDAFLAALDGEIADLTARSAIDCHLVIQGVMPELSTATESAAISATRQALVNVEQHADAQRVIVTVRSQGTELVIVIQDDGIGIPETVAIDPVPRSDSRLGLASVARRVERAGGSFWVHKGEESGTILRIQLPTAQSHARGSDAVS